MIDRLRHSMNALQMLVRVQEVTANNLANINTPGFKADKLFYRAFAKQLNERSVSGVEAHQTIQMQQGTFESTGNTFDLAIEGEGFFEVEHDGKLFLTRNGRFSVNNEGYLIDDAGAYLQGHSGAIQLPQYAQSQTADQQIDIEITKDGTIQIDDIAQDRIKLIKVDDVQSLERRNNTYFKTPENAPHILDEESQVVQGFYESGNVEPLAEMVDMTSNMRLFESQQKAMQTTDEILSQVTTRLGRF